MIIAVDPGAKGAVAWTEKAGDPVGVESMPDTIQDIWDLLRDLVRFHEPEGVLCYLENVGKYVPGNSGPAAATFAEHVGGLKMALTGIGIPWELVSPQTWQKRIGTLPKDKADRKRTIKERMQSRFPNVKVTLTNADALGILLWAIDKQGALK